jgi:hypothetical protein
MTDQTTPTSPAPGTPQTADKAVAAFLTGAVGVVAMFVPAIRDYLTPEVIAAASMLIGTALVYLIPNRAK